MHGHRSILGIMPRKKSTKKKTLTKKQLDILYECWKNADTTKDRLALIERDLPKVPSLAALSIMRRMAKSDSKWLKWSTRKKNIKEKEKLEKQKERERKKLEREQKRKEREEKRKERDEAKKHKSQLTLIREELKDGHFERVTDAIEDKYFFCPDVHQFVNTISCVFRIFSDEHLLSRCTQCDKCSRFSKHIPILEEIIKDGRRKKAPPNKTKGATRSKTSAGSKIKKKKSDTRKAKGTRKTKGSS